MAVRIFSVNNLCVMLPAAFHRLYISLVLSSSFFAGSPVGTAFALALVYPRTLAYRLC
jgi:hypothetical protein